MTNTLVQVDNLSKKFCRDLKRSLWYGLCDLGSELLGRRHGGSVDLRPDEFWAVKQVSFELARGECLGLIGRNGAGKTTLLRILNGLIKPDQGRVQVRGRVGALISLGAGFNPVLTGRENIYVNGAVLGLSKRDIDRKFDEIVDFAELHDFIDAPVQSYSAGMHVRLGFSIASAVEPDILLMDEILAVGDMAFQAKCFNKLAELRQKGVASVLVSHNMHHVSRFCTKAMCLSQGISAVTSPVASAISEYLEADRHCRISDAGNTTFLTDQLEIDGPRFLDDSGEVIEVSQCRHDLVITLDYRQPRELLNDPIVEFILRLDDGTPFIHFTTKDRIGGIGKLAQAGRLSLRIQAMPLNNQRLHLSTAIWDRRDGKLVFWKYGSPSIFIRGNPMSIGVADGQIEFMHSVTH